MRWLYAIGALGQAWHALAMLSGKPWQAAAPIGGTILLILAAVRGC